MKSAKKASVELPTTEQIEKERARLRHKSRYSRTLRSTIAILVVVAAVAVLVATLWMPVLRIYGSSMAPTLNDGQIVISLKTIDFKTGDIAAFYYGNKLLIKRYIAGASDWVYIDEDGTVSVNSIELDEPYLAEKALGQTNIDMPYQVPDKRYFLMGDNREASVDSRNTAVGCVSEEQIVGKVVFCIWPIDRFGPVR
ncbi:signal peptidase I [Pseudoflavonifractor phocaeensis]|uniref:signal peptidase I n=1 Tax=Pseudoflavonifractor phocaeensis TaxID=1870988 RepID=UPI002109F91F|nr:signal peptidase I [Pseudoflavonifractor phocaeensis]MCQ4863210.1 signal peptidase I [Pseudoflavonifractor phocaeensis]